MKDNDKLLPVLYLLLADELTDLKDKVGFSEECLSLCSVKTGKTFRKPRLNEMQNAEWLIERIVFWGGALKDSNPDAMIGKSVSEKIRDNQSDGFGTGSVYTDTVNLTREADDQDIADMMRRIHKMQDDHSDWFGMSMFT